MSLNQPLLLSSALVHQVLLTPATYPSKHLAIAEGVLGGICPSCLYFSDMWLRVSMIVLAIWQEGEQLLTWRALGFAY